MKYMTWLIGLLGLGTGFAAGYYMGKKKEAAAYEADIASIEEEFSKKIDEAKRRFQKTYGDTKSEDEEQKLTPNGDVDDIDVEVTTYSEAVKHNMEDVVYFAKDNVWYNQDQEMTYDKANVFDVPVDLFSYFGDGAEKTDMVYICNKKTDRYFALKYNPGSYVTEILGYNEASSEGGKEE